MKNSYLIFFILILGSCTCKKVAHENIELSVEARHYAAAMGSGNGVIFQINGVNNQKDSIWIDSVIIADKTLPFTQTQYKPIQAEASYFVPNDEPKDDHSKQIESDKILNKQYQPAYLIYHTKDKQINKYPLTSIISTHNTE